MSLSRQVHAPERKPDGDWEIKDSAVFRGETSPAVLLEVDVKAFLPREASLHHGHHGAPQEKSPFAHSRVTGVAALAVTAQTSRQAYYLIT